MLFIRKYGQINNHKVTMKIYASLEHGKMDDQPLKLTRHETAKDFPSRYPSNDDSIGIELVGKSYKIKEDKEAVYENVTEAQNTSLQWLIHELASTLNVTMTEVYKHPQVGRKNPSEASTAKW